VPHLLRLSIVVGVALTLASCAWQGGLQPDQPEAFALSYATSIDDAESCATAINASSSISNAISPRVTPLPGDEIRVFNWNVQKNATPGMLQDMRALASNADLVLLQEATLRNRRHSSEDGGYHWAFAPGYETSRELTGVMTASKVAPITHCSFKNLEPWLGSPKATNITQYALADRDDTLLVINLHLINFTLGIQNMQHQLDEALAMIEKHQGPVIISGDFNTWSEARDRSVNESLVNAGLQPVAWQIDLRKRFFGYAVDHMYIRGLQAEPGSSHQVYSSDHNPLSVVLKLNQPATASTYQGDDNG
jgi:endonuclease/exonuclease/phosphatase (EEP) superfamily protein YafD